MDHNKIGYRWNTYRTLLFPVYVVVEECHYVNGLTINHRYRAFLQRATVGREKNTSVVKTKLVLEYIDPYVCGLPFVCVHDCCILYSRKLLRGF